MMVRQTISHYRIESRLGEGGMGVVHKGEDTRLGRSVPWKFLAPHVVSDEQTKTPDNRFIACSVGEELKRIPAQGGTATTISRLAGAFRGATWSADGTTIVYCDQVTHSPVMKGR